MKEHNFKSKTSLKRIELYRLKELILADLKDYPISSISEINTRMEKKLTKELLKQNLMNYFLII